MLRNALRGSGCLSYDVLGRNLLERSRLVFNFVFHIMSKDKSKYIKVDEIAFCYREEDCQDLIKDDWVVLGAGTRTDEPSLGQDPASYVHRMCVVLGKPSRDQDI